MSGLMAGMLRENRDKTPDELSEVVYGVPFDEFYKIMSGEIAEEKRKLDENYQFVICQVDIGMLLRKILIMLVNRRWKMVIAFGTIRILLTKFLVSIARVCKFE